MRHLLTITQQDFDPSAPEADLSTFSTRHAARAILLDPEGRIYLLNVSNHGYHKLPGGGIDDGESIEEGLRRELLEEVGCEADITAEVGEIIEHRVFQFAPDPAVIREIQTSYCFIARQRGAQRPAALEELEIAAGIVEAKVSGIEEAIATLKHDQPDDILGQFIQKRDLAFLEAARDFL